MGSYNMCDKAGQWAINSLEKPFQRFKSLRSCCCAERCQRYLLCPLLRTALENTADIAHLWLHDITAQRAPTRKSHYWLRSKQWSTSNWLQKGCNTTSYYGHSDYAHRSKRVGRINVKGIWLQKREVPKKQKARKEAKGKKFLHGVEIVLRCPVRGWF